MTKTYRGFESLFVGLLFLLSALCLLIPCHPLAAAPFPITRLFSGVASAGGINDTQWRSEVVLSNAAGAATDLVLEVIPRDQTNVVASMSLTLAPGETRHLPDLYAALGAPAGAGTLRLTGDALVWVRTFNQAARGTFGLDVPGVSTDDGFQSAVPVLFLVNTPADAGKEFRSNLLVTNLEAKKVTFTLMAGAQVKTLDVEAGTFTQINGVGSWLGAPQGPAVLSVVANGRWFGLVTTVDPVLGDPTNVRGLAGTTRDTRVFAGVASAGGMNGTAWRSEAHLFNPRLTSQSVTLEIVPRGGSSVAKTTTIALGPLEMKWLPDVYAAVGAASGAGVLRVSGDVLTWIRTFNQGTKATFGTDVPEVAPGVGYGTGARVAFPVSSTADITTGFRSNFLVYNHESRAITCTFSAGGVSGTLDVPAGSFIQQDNLGAFLGLPSGQRLVEVSANGRWSAIVTAIDPYLGDPTTVLGLLTSPNPVPTGVGTTVGTGASATIGPSGGTVASPDGRLTLSVPAGAVTAPTAFTVQPITNLAWGGLGNAYRLGPDGTTFAKPVTVTFAPTAGDKSSTSLEGLGIGFQDGDGYWQWMSDATRDLTANRISVSTSHLSPWSLLSGLNLLPPSASVEEGGTLDLRIQDCYPPALAPLDAPTAQEQIPGVPCQSVGSYFSSFWSVEGVVGGNGTFGTVQGEWILGHYAAPAKAPSPNTVAVTALVNRYFALRNVTLVSHVTIGGVLEGTFDLNVARKDGAKYGVRGDAKLKAFMSDENGIAYDMTGTVTIDSSFGWQGLTCSCTDPLTKAIPTDSVFSIRRNPSLGQRWVMPAVSWNFRCSPPGSTEGITMPVFIQYFVSQSSGCNEQFWVSLADERHPAGSFVSTCNPAFSVAGSWDFQ